MMETVTKKQHKEMHKKLIEFCKKDSTNYCLMYNYMRTIEQIRKEPEEKLLMKKLKKQADEYKKRKKKK